MRTFNLEKALAGKGVMTRNGEEVTDLHLFNVSDSHKLYGVVNNNILPFTCNGSYISDPEEHYNDLFMSPVKLQGVVNIYADGTTCRFNSKKVASKDNIDVDVIACIDLSQFNEGEGL